MFERSANAAMISHVVFIYAQKASENEIQFARYISPTD